MTDDGGCSFGGDGGLRPPARERAIACKTLVSFLQSLEGERVTIEARDDSRITGHLLHVDAFMNCNLTDVLIRRPIAYDLSFEDSTCVQERLDHLFVKGTRIRYVTFDETIRPIERIQGILDQGRQASQARATASRRSSQPPPADAAAAAARGKNPRYYRDPRSSRQQVKQRDTSAGSSRAEGTD